MATWDTEVMRNQAEESRKVERSYGNLCKAYVVDPGAWGYPSAPSILEPIGRAIVVATGVLGRDIDNSMKVYQHFAENIEASATYYDTATADNLAAIGAIWEELGPPTATGSSYQFPTSSYRRVILGRPHEHAADTSSSTFPNQSSMLMTSLKSWDQQRAASNSAALADLDAMIGTPGTQASAKLSGDIGELNHFAGRLIDEPMMLSEGGHGMNNNWTVLAQWWTGSSADHAQSVSKGFQTWFENTHSSRFQSGGDAYTAISQLGYKQEDCSKALDALTALLKDYSQLADI